MAKHARLHPTVFLSLIPLFTTLHASFHHGHVLHKGFSHRKSQCLQSYFNINTKCKKVVHINEGNNMPNSVRLAFLSMVLPLHQMSCLPSPWVGNPQRSHTPSSQCLQSLFNYCVSLIVVAILLYILPIVAILFSRVAQTLLRAIATPQCRYCLFSRLAARPSTLKGVVAILLNILAIDAQIGRSRDGKKGGLGVFQGKRSLQSL